MTTGRLPSQIQNLKTQSPLIDVDKLINLNDYEFVTFLDQKDTQGNSFLHRLYRTQPQLFNKILERISKIKSPNDKKTINQTALRFDNEPGHTIFHEVIEKKSAQALYQLILAFGNETWEKALNLYDKNSHNTVLHYACSSSTDTHLKLKMIYDGLISLEQKNKTTREKVLSRLFSDNLAGCNPLHFFAIKNSTDKNSKIRDLNIVSKLCGSLSKELLIRALTQFHAGGINRPLEMACRSRRNDILFEFLHSLEEHGVDKKTLSLIMQGRNRRSETLIHGVCRYGDHRVIEKVFSLLTPKGLCRLQLSELKYPNHSFQSLKSIIERNMDDTKQSIYIKNEEKEKNKNLLQAYQNIMLFNPLFLLVNLFTYLVERGLTNKNSDYTTRLNDFISCLKSLTFSMTIPEEPGGLRKFFHTHRYAVLRDALGELQSKNRIDSSHLKKFLNLLQDPDLPESGHELAKIILSQIDLKSLFQSTAMTFTNMGIKKLTEIKLSNDVKLPDVSQLSSPITMAFSPPQYSEEPPKAYIPRVV